MQLNNTTYNYTNTVVHQGTSFAFFIDDSNAIFYLALDLQGLSSNDDQSWTTPEVLEFEDDMKPFIRPLGMTLIEADPEVAGTLSGGLFQVVSDGRYVYVFRLSSNNQIYVSRFVMINDVAEEDTTGRYGKALRSSKALLPAWEVRYKYSREKDTPLNDKDVQDYTDPGQSPFYEPPQQIPYLQDVKNGQFAVALTPTDIPNRSRWHIFSVNTKNSGGDVNQKIHYLTILQSDEGLFDFASISKDSLNVFVLKDDGSSEKLLANNGMSACYYRSREEVPVNGSPEILNIDPHMMLALSTYITGGDKDSSYITVLDFEMAKDGTLAIADKTLTLKKIDSAGPMGKVWTDDRGFSIEGAILEFAPSLNAPFLLNSGDGNVHMYFNNNELNAQLNVANFQTQTTRTQINRSWKDNSGSANPQEGEIAFTARSSGTLNSPSVSINNVDGYTYLCDVVLAYSENSTETWRYVPRPLGEFMATLKGLSSEDVFNFPQLNKGFPFYDYDGLYPAYLHDLGSEGFGLLMRVPAVLSRDENPAVPQYDTQITLNNEDQKLKLSSTVTVSVPTDSDPVDIDITEIWQLPLDITGEEFVQIINGTSPSFNYQDSSLASITLSDNGYSQAIYSSRIEGGQFWFFVTNPNENPMIENPKINRMVFAVEDGKKKALCTLTVTLPISDTDKLVATWKNISRDFVDFATSVTKTNNPDDAESIIAPLLNFAGFGSSQKITNLLIDAEKSTKGGSIFAMAANYLAGDEKLDSNSLELTKVQPGRTLAGDIAAQVKARNNGKVPHHSALYIVTPIELPDSGYVALIESDAAGGSSGETAVEATPGPGWVEEPPREVFVSTSGQKAKSTNGLSVRGNLSLEAYLAPTKSISGTRSILYYSKDSGSAGYSLSLQNSDDENYVIAQNGDVAARAAIGEIDDDLWQHFAATYDSGFFLEMDPAGKEQLFVDCGSNIFFPSSDLTIEANLKAPKITTDSDVHVVGQWGDTVSKQSWLLGLDNKGKPFFQIARKGESPVRVTAEEEVDDDQWRHIAGVLENRTVDTPVANFNGDRYIYYPDHEDFNPPVPDKFTAECWVEPYNLDTQKAVLFGVNQTNSTNYFLVRYNGNAIAVDVVETRVTIAANTLEPHHLAVTVEQVAGSGTRITVYKNGVLLGEPVLAKDAYLNLSQDDLKPWAIGIERDSDKSDHFNGVIREFRLWDRILSTGEISGSMNKSLTGKEPGLLSYLPINEGWGTVVRDKVFSDDVTQGTEYRPSFNGDDLDNLWSDSFIQVFYLSLYIDGRMQSRIEVDSLELLEVDSPVLIGGSQLESAYAGAIDDVRLWGVARSAGNISFYKKDVPYPVLPTAIQNPDFSNNGKNWTMDDSVTPGDFSKATNFQNYLCFDNTGSQQVKQNMNIPEGAAYIGYLVFPKYDASDDWNSLDGYQGNAAAQIVIGDDNDNVTYQPNFDAGWIKPLNSYTPTWIFGDVQAYAGSNTIGMNVNGYNSFYNKSGHLYLFYVAFFDAEFNMLPPEIVPGHALSLDTSGLISAWVFNEGRGKVAIDSKGGNDGVVKDIGTQKTSLAEDKLIWIADQEYAKWRLFMNGQELDAQTVDATEFQGKQLSLGGSKNDDGDWEKVFKGDLNEVRIWDRIRTPEQIRDNMNRRLIESEKDIVGYWPLDEGGSSDTAKDQSGNGNDFTGLTAANWTDSNPPIGTESPIVRNILGGPDTGMEVSISSIPAVFEYSDMQEDDSGMAFGVLKRGYLYVSGGTANLVTGFKIDDLEMTYLGMVQTKPTLIGYIEGAPPVPRENLTRPLWLGPEADEYIRYFDSSTVALNHSESVEYGLSNFAADTTSDSQDFSIGALLKAETRDHTPIGAEGVGKSRKQFEFEARVGYHLVHESETTDESALKNSVATTKQYQESVAFRGVWEPRSEATYPIPGRHFVSSNMGYALVKSRTAEVYSLKLKGYKTSIGQTVLPNSEIPEDWNVIMFPINPKYTKTDCLDGMIGLVPDPDFPNAKQQRSSFFRPQEAYAIQQRIEQSEKNLEGYYMRQSVKRLRDRTKNGGLRDALPDLPGSDSARKLSKRNLVGTAVWNSEGGKFTSTSEVLGMRDESFGSSYQDNLQQGLTSSFDIAGGPAGSAVVGGIFAELDALWGESLNVRAEKTQEESSGFSMDLSVDTDTWMQTFMLKGAETNETLPDFDDFDGYEGIPTPGKVDGYRFNSYYLAPNERNTSHFYSNVVRPDWLYTSNSPDAIALREAMNTPNSAWRCFHRVTYVSRVKEPWSNVPNIEAGNPAAVAPNIDSNLILASMVDASISNQGKPSRIEIGVAVDQVLSGKTTEGEDAPYYVAQLFPWWKSVKTDDPLFINTRRKTFHYMLNLYDNPSLEIPSPIDFG